MSTILLQAFFLFHSKYLSYQYYCWWDISLMAEGTQLQVLEDSKCCSSRATVKYKVPQQRYKNNKVFDHLFHAFDTTSLVKCLRRPKEGNEETRCLTAKHNHHRILLSAHKVTSHLFTTQAGLHSRYSTLETQGRALLFSSCRQWTEERRKMTDRTQLKYPPSSSGGTHSQSSRTNIGD